MRLVGRHDTGRRLVFHVELRGGRVVHAPPPASPEAPASDATVIEVIDADTPPSYSALAGNGGTQSQMDASVSGPACRPHSDDGGTPAGAAAASAHVATPSLASRLLELKEAKDAGLITEKEYEQTRASIMAGLGAPPPPEQQQQQQQQQPGGPALPLPPSYDDLGLESTSVEQSSC